MGMPRKGSRRIDVGTRSFLWRVAGGDKRYENFSNEFLRLTVQEDVPEPGNVAQFLLKSRLWTSLDEDQKEHGYGHHAELTPADVRNLISHALAQGWDPAQRGAAFQVPPGLTETLTAYDLDRNLVNG